MNFKNWEKDNGQNSSKKAAATNGVANMKSTKEGKKTDYTKWVDQVKEIPDDLLRRFKEQPRRKINQKKIQQYAEEMQERIANGERPQIKPGVVMLTNDPNCPFELISGEHRWEACKLVGCKFVAYIEPWMPLEKQKELALAYNHEGEEMTPGEVALYLQDLQDDNSRYNVSKLARICSRSRGWVQAHLDLLDLRQNLFDIMQEPEAKDRIPIAIAREIAKLPASGPHQQAAYQEIQDEEMTAKQATSYVQRKLQAIERGENGTPPPPKKKQTAKSARDELTEWLRKTLKEAVQKRGNNMDPFHEMFGNLSELEQERVKQQCRDLNGKIDSIATAITTVQNHPKKKNVIVEKKSTERM